MQTLLLLALVFLAAGPAIPASDADRPAAQKQDAPPPEARIDINRASAEELMKVPGMSRTWAERIVRFRPYRAKQDLADKGVVPANLYDRIKNFVIARRDGSGSKK